MAADLKLLVPQFAEKVEKLVEECAKKALIMRPICTIRTPQEQAKLWRQSRTSEEIRLKILELRKQGLLFLADLIDKTPPCSGPQVTKVIPGFSWHQWGEAVDCVWIKEGKAEWNDLSGYQLYGKVASNLGLDAGANWKWKDYPHVQFRTPGVASVYDNKKINDEMKKRFSK